MISEERENRALSDIKVSKTYSDREVSKPATESLTSFRMLPSDNTVEKISTPLPLPKLQKNDDFTNNRSCLRGRESSFISRTDSVIEVDDDVPETTISGIRISDNNVEEKSDNHMVKNIKFNIRTDPTSSATPRSKGTFVVTSSFQVPI